MQRDIHAEFGGPRAQGQWPIYSDAMAVHPSQIADAKHQADVLGVPTEFVEQDCPEADKWAGQPIFTSQRHQDEYLRKVTGGKIVNLDKYG